MAKKIHIILILLMMIFAGVQFAQTGRGQGRLHGKIMFDDGNPFPEVHVKLTLVGTVKLQAKIPSTRIWDADKNKLHTNIRKLKHPISRETKTDIRGNFTFMGLGYGIWKIEILKDGFNYFTKHMEIRTLEKNKPIEIILKKSAITSSDNKIIGKGGKHLLRGTVFLSTGKAAGNIPVKLILLGKYIDRSINRSQPPHLDYYQSGHRDLGVTQTDKNGNFRFLCLDRAAYGLAIDLEGHEPVRFLINQLNIKLKITLKKTESPQSAVDWTESKIINQALVQKTYQLVNIDVNELVKNDIFNFIKYECDQKQNTLTVTIPQSSVSSLDKRIKELDLPKQKVYLEIIPWILEKTAKKKGVSNPRKDLKSYDFYSRKDQSFGVFTLLEEVEKKLGLSVPKDKKWHMKGKIVSISQELFNSPENIKLEFFKNLLPDLELLINEISIQDLPGTDKKLIKFGTLILKNKTDILFSTSTSIVEGKVLIVGSEELKVQNKVIVIFIYCATKPRIGSGLK